MNKINYEQMYLIECCVPKYMHLKHINLVFKNLNLNKWFNLVRYHCIYIVLVGT